MQRSGSAASDADNTLLFQYSKNLKELHKAYTIYYSYTKVMQ